jgi:hypothetical protein
MVLSQPRRSAASSHRLIVVWVIIITFGNKTKPATRSISLFSNPKTPEAEKPILMRRSIEKKDELKRHSFAVDESRYVDEHQSFKREENLTLKGQLRSQAQSAVGIESFKLR